MRVLLDVCMPMRLIELSGDLEVVHSTALGWGQLQNGKLIAAANGHFEVLVTVDKNIRFQQNLANMTLCVAILDVPNTNLETHLKYWEIFLSQTDRVEPGEFVVFTETLQP